MNKPVLFISLGFLLIAIVLGIITYNYEMQKRVNKLYVESGQAPKRLDNEGLMKDLATLRNMAAIVFVVIFIFNGVVSKRKN